MEQKIYIIARDENCDLYVGSDFQLAMVEGKEAYAQIVNAKMRTSLGEMQLAMQKGIPYFQTIFQDAKYLPIWENEVMSMLEALPFVIEVSSFDCNIKDGVVEYTAEIKTDKGALTING